MELLVQFNSRPKTRIKVDAELSPAEIEKLVLENDAVKQLLNGATPKKVIVIPARLVNVIL